MQTSSDFEEILLAFNAASVRYLVVGAYAVAAYARPRATDDIDLCVECSSDNAPRVYRALAAFGAPVMQAVPPAVRVRCSDDLDVGLAWAERNVALRHCEIAPDPPGWKTALRFDVDCPCDRRPHVKSGYCPRAATCWREVVLAEPSFIVVNPANGHAHYVYLLRGWLRVDGANAADLAAVRYFVAIERAYTRALRADAGFTDAEALDTAKSVAGWVWLRYVGGSLTRVRVDTAARREVDRNRAAAARRERGAVPRDVWARRDPAAPHSGLYAAPAGRRRRRDRPPSIRLGHVKDAYLGRAEGAGRSPRFVPLSSSICRSPNRSAFDQRILPR